MNVPWKRVSRCCVPARPPLVWFFSDCFSFWRTLGCFLAPRRPYAAPVPAEVKEDCFRQAVLFTVFIIHGQWDFLNVFKGSLFLLSMAQFIWSRIQSNFRIVKWYVFIFLSFLIECGLKCHLFLWIILHHYSRLQYHMILQKWWSALQETFLIIIIIIIFIENVGLLHILVEIGIHYHMWYSTTNTIKM